MATDDSDQYRKAMEAWSNLLRKHEKDETRWMEEYLSVNIFDDPIPETDWDAELKKLIGGD